jgi:hypothetical protein
VHADVSVSEAARQTLDRCSGFRLARRLFETPLRARKKIVQIDLALGHLPCEVRVPGRNRGADLS